MDTETLIRVAKAWSHKDDWNVDTIDTVTLGWLADMLNQGVDPDILAAHAKHTISDCLRSCGDWLKQPSTPSS